MKLKTYSPEFRAEAVKLVLEQGLSQEQAASGLEYRKETLVNWVSAAKRSTDPAAPPGSRSVAELEAELAKLRKELAVERMEKEVLKGHHVLCEGVAARYAFMKTVRFEYPLGLLCRVFGMSRSGFYAALDRPASQRAQDDERLKIAIKAAHVQTRETYGPLRLKPELVAQGFDPGRDRIVRLRRELGLRCKQKRRFKATTNSKHLSGSAESAGTDLRAGTAERNLGQRHHLCRHR